MKDTESRILDAATKVFAKKGVSGATTREIARLARVNEVTLFRCFRNKNELLRRVVGHSKNDYSQVFTEAPLKTAADLRQTVENYAQLYAERLLKNEEFVRTFIGEMNRHLKLCQRIFVESGAPTRLRFIAYLRAAQKAKLMRKELDPVMAADSLTGMLMAGVIRRPLTQPDYATERYVKTCLNVFLKGIQP